MCRTHSSRHAQEILSRRAVPPGNDVLDFDGAEGVTIADDITPVTGGSAGRSAGNSTTPLRKACERLLARPSASTTTPSFVATI